MIKKKISIPHKNKKPSKIKLTYQNREVYAFNLSDERHFVYDMSTLWKKLMMIILNL